MSRGGWTYGTIFDSGAGLIEQPPRPASAEQRAHQRQEVSAAERVGPNIGLLRKFQPHQLLKSLGIRQFVERAPKMLSLGRSQFLAERGKLRPEIFSRVHRWQTVQLVRKVAS